MIKTDFFIGSISSLSNSIFLFNDEDLKTFIESLDSSKSSELKIITQPLKYTTKEDNGDSLEHSILHPLSQIYLYSFFLKNSFKFQNYFELNKIYALYNNHQYDTSNWTLLCNYFNTQLTLGSKIIDYCYKSFNNNPINNYLNKLERKYAQVDSLEYISYKEHLYTHSIDWAYLGDREIAKKYLAYKKRFSSQLDSLIQKTNYNETNGIINGNSVSDIIGELVLTRIDRLVYDELKSKNLSYKNNYEIVRDGEYIYIFALQTEQINIIKEAIYKHARLYRLNLTDNHVSNAKKPFIANVIWETTVNNLADSVFTIISDINNYKKESASFSFSDILIELKSLILKNNYEYTIIPYFLKSELKKIVNSITQLNQSAYSINDTINENKFMPEQINKYYNFLFDICSINTTETNINLLIDNIECINSFIGSSISLSHEIYNEIYDDVFNIYLQILKFNINDCCALRNVILICSFYNKDIPQKLLLNYLYSSSDELRYLYVTFYINKKNLQFKYHDVCNHLTKYFEYLLNTLDKKCDRNSNSSADIPKSADVGNKESFGNLLGRYELLLLLSVKDLKLFPKPLMNRIKYYIDLVKLLKLNFHYDKSYCLYITQDSYSWINWNLEKNELICLLSKVII
ncbi:MAG: hypothetical protein KIC94_08890 [Clostridiales bacterium]|nr:hypothetical protein [Clostridiales bacterium]